jgi:uncharacterized protein with WD repeat
VWSAELLGCLFICFVVLFCQPPDEVKPFETRASRMAAQPNRIPGMPTPPPAAAPAPKPKPQTQQPPQQPQQQQKLPAAAAAAAPPAENDGSNLSSEERAKKARALKKKLREILDLEALGKDKLSAEQQSKIQKKASIEEEIRQLESGDDAVTSATSAVAGASISDKPSGDQRSATASTSTSSTAPSAARSEEEIESREKKAKGIRKKLKQIEELETKQQSGTALDSDQQKKVAQKGELQAELAALL